MFILEQNTNYCDSVDIKVDARRGLSINDDTIVGILGIEFCENFPLNRRHSLPAPPRATHKQNQEIQ